MRRFLFKIMIITAAWVVTSPSVHASSMSAPVAVDELPLPVLPDGMTDPVSRADYILLHFWDSMDFSDGAKSNNREFMEQNLVNFFSVMPHASAEGRQIAVENIMSRASADKQSFSLVVELAEHYLYEPGSPMRDEELFIPFAEEAVKSTVLSDAERIRPKYLLDEAMRNRVGTMSADFTMRLRDGSTVDMHKFSAGRPTILMFYDPDCDHCAETIAEIKSDSALSALIESAKLNMIAVYPFGEEEVWDSKDVPAKIPSGWSDAFADLSESDIYSFPEMPVLYLLDGHGRVLLKDAPFSKIATVAKSL